MKIAHLIPSLATGGAEELCSSLIRAQLSKGHEVTIATFISVPERELSLRECGASIQHVRPLPWSIRRWIADQAPDSVIFWMYHSVLLGSFTPGARLGTASIHHSSPSDSGLKVPTRLIAWLDGRLVNRMQAVVYVSEESRLNHERHGWPRELAHVVPPGVDESRFRVHSVEERQAVKGDLGIPPNAPVLLHVARWHPDKNQALLFAAFARAVQLDPSLVLVCVGRGMDRKNPELNRVLADVGLAESKCLRFLGERHDLEKLHGAADIFCLSSSSEALPVSLIEAMLSGAMPVVTDVGDMPRIASQVGRVVQSGDAIALSRAMVQASRDVPDVTKRNHVRSEVAAFTIASMCSRYEEILAGEDA